MQKNVPMKYPLHRGKWASTSKRPTNHGKSYYTPRRERPEKDMAAIRIAAASVAARQKRHVYKLWSLLIILFTPPSHF